MNTPAQQDAGAGGHARLAFADAWRVASRVNGWLTRREGSFLFAAARAVPSGGRIVEIGSFFGRSTLCLAFGSSTGHGANITAVDPHVGSPKHVPLLGCADTYPYFLANLERAGVRDLVTPVRATSVTAAAEHPEQIDLLFVDGSHELADVRADFECWFPKLRPGGLIAFHDSWHMSGVRRLTTRLLRARSELAEPRLIDTITVCRKNAGGRLRHAGFVARRACCAWIGFLRLTYLGTRLHNAERARVELPAPEPRGAR